VVGGQDAQVGAWPWSVSLQISEGRFGYSHVCGGVLITESSVLTAAHCTTARTDPYSWRAVLGVHNLWRPDKHTVRREIKSITVHPGFERQLFEHDIALFELAAAVSYSPYIQPICLPPPHLHPDRDNDTKCFISGWGRTAEKGKTSAILQEAQVEIIPPSVCSGAEAYGALVNINMICAGSPSGGTDTCQGDSGGPLACYYPSADQYYLLGIASFGVGCGRRKFPGIYVRVSQYRAWI
ncbi:TMPSC protease, partial [Tricholaema leucomelas]|nr:TMPSC protease [Tricholaema leucomelas]